MLLPETLRRLVAWPGALTTGEHRTLPPPASPPRLARRAWTGLLAIVICAPLAAQEPASGIRPPSNARMAERLEALAAARLATLENDRDNAARLEALRAMPPFTDPGEQSIYEASVAGELLRGGRTEEAIVELERLRRRLEVDHRAVPSHLPAFPTEMRRSLAIAYAKLAQDDNCLRRKTAARCAVPADEESVHPTQEAARKAIALYGEMAEEAPDDMVVRWMLNLAYMWVGEHPDGIRPEWRIPRSTYGSTTGVAPFVDVAPRLGLDIVGAAGGSVMEDFDADGDLDVLASSWGLRDPLRYLRNNGDGTFDDASLEAGLEGIVAGLNLSSADYDNDGLPDVLLLRGAWTRDPVPNSLLRSNGDGTFTDVTEAAGLLRAAPTQTGVWGDHDNDGDVDLFLGNESRSGSTYPSELYSNNGDGTFTDVAAQAGVQVTGVVKGAAWGDVDNDGRLDLFVSRLGEPNLLFRNEGPSPDGRWRFRDITAAAGVAEPRNSFPTWFFDYDNDGWLDLFVAGYRTFLGDLAAEALGRPLAVGQGYPLLYRNRGDGTFADVTAAVGLRTIMPVMGSNFGDLDNDGYPELYLGTGAPGLEMLTPNRVFRNAGGKRFENVAPAGGFGHLQKGHAVSFGDIDHDGDQDVYVVLGGYYEGDVSRNVLMLNPGHGNAWITLRLRGTASNRLAMGARIAVAVATPDGDRVVHAVAGTGGSFGASTLQQEIGLGSATTIRELTVEWPGSGRRDVYREVPINRVVLVREGDAAVTPVAVDPLDLGPSP
ncbi:MAG: CRTAC1 family protein [Acidobacteria bacterium]|nr:CRTAC1 family protein [Acidobacteriota bacterium]